MLQACMKNAKEYKIVVINNTAMYEANNASKKGVSFSKYPHTELLKFAEDALFALKVKCPSTIADGLVRVDIFKTLKGKLVVNEFESLEACYYSKRKNSDLTIELNVAKYLRETYWSSQLIKFIQVEK